MSGEVVEEFEVGSDSCDSNGICSASLSYSLSKLAYRVSVIASSMLGLSDIAVFNSTICK